jgi:DNA (cytosine-5)-methyltransferase 1
MNGQQLTSIDLFSGCGGMTLGFSWAGFSSVLASDIDENCEKTFATNFPEIPFLCGDLSDFKKEDFDSHIKNNGIDVIIGGPPCQGFSLANKRRNKVSNDPRNRLFYEFVKTIDWYNPKAFVMENVKGLLSMHSGMVIKQILKEFESAGTYGYDVDYKILKATDYGVPQSRERVIVIGVRKDLGIHPTFPESTVDKEVTVDEAISDLPQIKAGEGSNKMKYGSKPQSDYQVLMRKNSNSVFNHVAMKHTNRVIERFEAIKPGKNLLDVWETHGAVQRGNPNIKSKIKFSQNNLRLIADKPAPTIAASFQSNFIHPTLHRNFTAREGARLQSFPDDFIFEGMRTKMSWEKGLSQYQQIGNAVPPLMAYEIAKTLKKLLKSKNSNADLIDEIIEKH